MTNTQFSGIAASLPVPDIDTDTIIPIDYCINRERPNFDVALFRSWRYHNDGSEKAEFFLNTDPYRETKILITGANFGCGSSREMAVWALIDFGIRCVIAPSFGEIFYNNCFQNNLLAARVSPEIATALSNTIDQAVGLVLNIDLEEKTIQAGDSEIFHFELDNLRSEMLRQGLDPVTATLTREAEINAFEERDRVGRPWAHCVGTS